MNNRKVAHDLTRFVRVQSEAPPQKLPPIEVDPKFLKPLEDMYEIFWQATMPVSHTERTERLAKLEFQVLLIGNGAGLRRRVNELQAVAEHLEKIAMQTIWMGDRLGYKEDNTGMKAAYLKAKPYQSAALLLKAIATYVSELYNDPHNWRNDDKTE